MKKLKLDNKILLYCLGIFLIISLILFGLSIKYSNYNEDMKITLLNKLKNKKVQDFMIYKTNTTSCDEDKYFTDDDIKYIEDNVNEEITKVYELSEYDDIALHIELGISDGYDYSVRNTILIVNNWDNFKLIGRRVKDSHEVVINKDIADLIIKYGAYTVDIDTKNNQLNKGELFYPKNYKEIINSDNMIYYNGGVGNGTYIKIVGIAENDLTKFKNININDYGLNYRIYVNDDFLESTMLDENNRLSQGYIKLSHKIGDNDYFTPQGFYAFPNRSVNYYDGEKIVSTDSLKEDEVIIHYGYLKSFIKSNSYDNIHLAYRSGCDEYAEDDECLYKFLNDNNIIGSTIDVKINDFRKSSNSLGEKEYKNLKIIGFAVTDNENITMEYYSKDLLKPYMIDNIKISALEIHEDDFSEIEKLVNKFEISGYYVEDEPIKYLLLTPYNDYAYTRKDNMMKISKIFRVVSALLFVMSFICILGYICIKYKKLK